MITIGTSPCACCECLRCGDCKYLSSFIVNVVNNAISTIDKTGAFKGSFETAAEANAALGTGQPGQYYLNFQTDSAWFWNNQMVPPAWTDSRVTAARYNALTQAQKDAQRWNIIPG